MPVGSPRVQLESVVARPGRAGSGRGAGESRREGLQGGAEDQVVDGTGGLGRAPSRRLRSCLELSGGVDRDWTVPTGA
ncbi:hypothetical protein [Streptomyces sp. NPDC006463]|uniref:hypothetical protein n=1 Tax=Streptomyces sp. NPDC006463 TaxID=3364746 RepID=UPI0036BF96D5